MRAIKKGLAVRSCCSALSGGDVAEQLLAYCTVSMLVQDC